jgi:diguanylate cyclase (GGDEF)-like protein/PAS domain S-box-containing protein
MVGPIGRAMGALPGTAARLGAIAAQPARASVALRHTRQLFRMAFEDAPIGMAVLNVHGRYVAVNAAFCELVGRPSEHLLECTVESITHPEDIAQDGEDKRLLLDGERSTVTFEKRYVRACGDIVDVATQSTLLRDRKRRPMCFLVQAQDITDRRRYEEQLKYLADHDMLTGLLNRRAFNRVLEKHVAEVARYGPTGAVLVIDLDHFKQINDTLGHRAGDTFIAQVARLLAGRLRASDVIGRLGGDEFGVLLPRSDAPEALQVADGLLSELRGPPGRSGALDAMTTASIGIATFDGTSGGDALANADHAMYEAKQAGRDRVRRFSPTDSQSHQIA